MNTSNRLLKSRQGARKDVERAYGVLQARFAIVRAPARFWKCKTLKCVMKACIILLHNMIIEGGKELDRVDYDYDTTDKKPSSWDQDIKDSKG